MLLSAAVAGDAEAFRLLTAPHRRELLVHCYRMLGSLDDADDAVQETLLKAWRRLAGFEDRATLRPGYTGSQPTCVSTRSTTGTDGFCPQRSSARPIRTCPPTRTT
jgi:RNA polymerase sigma-70 factor (ECF subfamily)